MNKKTKPNNNSLKANKTKLSTNYYFPLQVIDDGNEDEVCVQKPTKVVISPITVLKCKIEELHEICKTNQVSDYSIRKISIGLKLFCRSKESFDKLCTALTNSYEYFTYGTKSEKPYKALLFGLDKYDPTIIKKKLLNMGLKCLDVKLVIKKNNHSTEFYIYVVYFERQSITLKELRQTYSVIDYVKIKWEFQQSKKNKITQCYNCQMFGHGSNRCNVKTFCANCAGSHKTSECSVTIVKCANCSGNHKSTSETCPSRSTYLEIRQRLKPTPRRAITRIHENVDPVNYNRNFPNVLRQNEVPTNNVWRYNTPNNTGSSELFTLEEIKNLTLELITNLRSCKCKADQFEVITNLACKFLS